MKADSKPLVVALTGGIAAGKTLVSDAFASLGVPVIDADVEARRVVVPGSPGLLALVDAFGPAILTADGQLDRAAMRQRIFSRPEERETLNAILHPLIGEHMQARAFAANSDYVLAVIPLLCETPPRDWIDRTLVVQADPALRKQRLMQRDTIDAQLAERMIAAQCSDADRLHMADDLILNEDDPDHVTQRVRHLHTFYQALAASR